MPSTLARLRGDRVLHRARHRRQRRLVQHVVHSGDHLARKLEVRDIALEKLHGRQVVEVASLAGDERIGHAHLMTAPHQFFRQVRTDESSAAGDEVLSHISLENPPLAVPARVARRSCSRASSARRPADSAAPCSAACCQDPQRNLRTIEKVPPQPAVSRILFPASALAGFGEATIIPLAPSSLTGSSDLPGGFGRAVLVTPPYLVLLRAGFCLPLVLPRARCALTAPFHPYSPSPFGLGGQARRSSHMFRIRGACPP